MEHIKTIDVIRLHTGNLELTDAQASSRRHLLTPVTDDNGKHITRKVDGEPRGMYAIKDTVTFKAGEEFGYDGEIKGISNKTTNKDGTLMAEVLLEQKVKARAAEAAAGQKAAAKPVNPQNVIDILAIIGDLVEGEDFGTNGKPKVEALEALLERDITAAERDAAWAEFQKGGD